VGGRFLIVADTHIIVWNALEPHKISKPARYALEQANDSSGIIICDITLWEIAMLMKKKRLDPGTDYITFMQLIMSANNYVLKGISPDIAILSVSLPAEINQDPADRIITATSITMGFPLITADINLQKSSSVQTVW
jgi:PIN domain nuclease of toxin-antitoxin system